MINVMIYNYVFIINNGRNTLVGLRLDKEKIALRLLAVLDFSS